MIERNLHAVYDLEYHLVIVTKYRHPVLTEEVKAILIACLKQTLTVRC